MVSYDKIVASATAVLMEGFDEHALCAYLVHMVSSRAGACLARLHALMAGERICAESVSVVSMGNSNTIATFARRAHMESSSSAATFARRAHMESSSRTAKSVVAVSMGRIKARCKDCAKEKRLLFAALLMLETWSLADSGAHGLHRF